MKENCCEDYNLSLPFFTDQQICNNEIFTKLLTQRTKQIKNSERNLHLRSLYWASKFTPFLSGYTTYQGTHTVAILKGEILKYAMETQALSTGGTTTTTLFLCVFHWSHSCQNPQASVITSPYQWTLLSHENIRHAVVYRLSYFHHKIWLKILNEYTIKNTIHHPT
jgi:hypothetical protein